MAKLLKLTEPEISLLDAFNYFIEQGERKKSRIYMLTAQKLKIAPSTVRSRVSRLRLKYELTLSLKREISGYQQQFFQKTGGRFNPLGRSGKAAK